MFASGFEAALTLRWAARMPTIERGATGAEGNRRENRHARIDGGNHDASPGGRPLDITGRANLSPTARLGAAPARPELGVAGPGRPRPTSCPGLYGRGAGAAVLGDGPAHGTRRFSRFMGFYARLARELAEDSRGKGPREACAVKAVSRKKPTPAIVGGPKGARSG